MIKTTLPLLYFPHQLLRLSDSHVWKEHMRSWDIIFEQADRCIQNIYQECCLGQERGYSGIMAELLMQGELPLDSIKANITELMAGGVDTTAMPLLFTLFELARNPSVQRELRDEIHKAEDQNPKDLNQLLNLMPLIKGTIKETLRLYPVGITVQRHLTKDITLHNYHIPSGTLVQVGLYPMGRSSSVFRDPLRYDPSRWMHRDDTNFKALAFGFGSRQCIGRRIAETEMMLFLMHMLKNFQIDTVCKEDIKTVFGFILMPEKPPLLTFRPI
ncbi:Catalyzes the side-chain cleavage reaction of cholesterol to pregnenolone [Pristimantis euphronides]